MNKQDIINQIAVLRQSAKQLENQVQKVLAYCAHVDALVNLDEIDWGAVALPVSAEDLGTHTLTCVKRAVKLDVLITLASEENQEMPPLNITPEMWEEYRIKNS